MNNVSEEAFKFAKKHKRDILEKFLPIGLQANDMPVFIFMAGAPGAGKTETSKWLIRTLKEEGLNQGIVRIDADELRSIFVPLGYDGRNSDEYKRGCNKGIEILFDSCLKNRYHVIIDGTFASLRVAERNIISAIGVGASIFIVYVYQDPLLAWGFTKVREKEEGRRVDKELFVKSLFQSIDNVDKIKEKYGDKIEIWFVEKDISNITKNIVFDIHSVDKQVKMPYNYTNLKELLYE